MEGTARMEELLHRLIAILDEDIDSLRRQHETIVGIREAFAGRDADAVLDLVQDAQKENDHRRHVDVEREKVRRELAERLGLDRDEATLSRLAGLTEGSLRGELVERKTRILAAVEALRKVHLSTAAALAGAARVNRVLLAAIFPDSASGTYTHRGEQAVPRDHPTMDLGA